MRFDLLAHGLGDLLSDDRPLSLYSVCDLLQSRLVHGGFIQGFDQGVQLLGIVFNGQIRHVKALSPNLRSGGLQEGIEYLLCTAVQGLTVGGKGVQPTGQVCKACLQLCCPVVHGIGATLDSCCALGQLFYARHQLTGFIQQGGQAPI